MAFGDHGLSRGAPYYRPLQIEELLMSQVISQETLTRLLMGKGISTRKNFRGWGRWWIKR
jgi:hypothetical protein